MEEAQRAGGARQAHPLGRGSGMSLRSLSSLRWSIRGEQGGADEGGRPTAAGFGGARGGAAARRAQRGTLGRIVAAVARSGVELRCLRRLRPRGRDDLRGSRTSTQARGGGGGKGRGRDGALPGRAAGVRRARAYRVEIGLSSAFPDREGDDGVDI